MGKGSLCTREPLAQAEKGVHTVENKKVSKKVPIILAAIYVVITVFMEVLYKILEINGKVSVLTDENVKTMVSLAEVAFYIGMMVIIRILSKSAQIKWLKIASTILLVFYSIGEIVLLITLVIIPLIRA